MEDQAKDFKHIVRISNTDIDGNKPISHALTKIKGIGFMYANALCNISKIDKTKKVGNLTDSEIKKIEDILKDPLKYKFPLWMLNRRKDYDSGEDKHLITSEVSFATDNDIKMMRMIKCYKGVRHSLGLPVRGQKTRSNFRKNKGNVMGVKRAKKAGRV